jgi:uncharacterized protein YndB with AHSA1/START domain
MKRALFVSMALARGLAACGGPAPIPMLNAPSTPAAQGTVVARPVENGNLKITIEVKHLAPPEKVSPTAKVYVTWVQPQGGPPQNVGALRVDEELTGRLETVTVHQSFELYITAEEQPAAAMPRGPRVLTAIVSQ